MRELSLHILDIVQNSIAAAASLIGIQIKEDVDQDRLSIQITDNGHGIPKDKIPQLTDPFFTSRQARDVGLGLSLFAQAARRCDGDIIVNSEVGKGTEVVAFFRYSHIDRAPLGDIPSTLIALVALNPEIDIVYKHIFQSKVFVLDTREVKRELGSIKINETPVLHWLREFINQGLDDLYGGE